MSINILKKLGNLFMISMVACLFCGCSKKDEFKAHEYFISSFKDAVEIEQSDKTQKENVTVLTPHFWVEKNGHDLNEELDWSIDKCVTHDGKVYALKLYYERESQYCEKCQVLSMDEGSKEMEVILEKSDLIWMNEFTAGGKYLYWVEYRLPDGKNEASISNSVEYRIIQYDLENGQEMVLGVRDGMQYDEICLEANENYVTWYDSCWNEDGTDGTHSLTVYDVNKEKFYDMDDVGSVAKYVPYERLNIYDGGITFFCEDDDGNITIHRLQLDTGRVLKLSIGRKRDYAKIAGCFSTQRYLGWFLDYGKGYYYIYDLKKEKLFKIDGKGIFSKYCIGDRFYAYYSNDDPAVRCYSLDDESVAYYDLQGLRGFQFQSTEEGAVRLEITDLTQYGMVNFE